MINLQSGNEKFWSFHGRAKGLKPELSKINFDFYECYFQIITDFALPYKEMGTPAFISFSVF